MLSANLYFVLSYFLKNVDDVAVFAVNNILCNVDAVIDAVDIVAIVNVAVVNIVALVVDKVVVIVANVAVVDQLQFPGASTQLECRYLFISY